MGWICCTMRNIYWFCCYCHSRTDAKKVIYGNARLATDMDLAKSTFFPTDKELKEARLKNSKPYCFPPILIGKQFKGRFKNKYIYFFGQQFLILYAPTRSGKGVGIVIPNCVNYPDSMVVLDIKLENWFLSAGYRQNVLGQECFLFAPAGYAENQQEAKKVISDHTAGILWTALIVLIFSVLEIWKKLPLC